MTSMSHRHHHHHHHHQAMTSWHSAPTTAAAVVVTTSTTPASGYHLTPNQYNQSSNQHAEHPESTYQLAGSLDMNTTDSTQSSTSSSVANQQQQYAHLQHPAARQQQFYSAASSPGLAPQTGGLEHKPAKQEPGMVSPVARHHLNHQPHAHHLQQDQSAYASSAPQEPAMYQQHVQHHPHHLHPHQRAAPSNSYYNEPPTNYQDQCHQDYYQMIQHSHQPQQLRAAAAATNIDSFQQQGQQPQAICWPTLAQPSSPQAATSPAIINHHHQFHLAGGNAYQAHSNPPPVSPLYATASATYTNGYPQQHTQAQQQQPQATSMHQQHYPAAAHHPVKVDRPIKQEHRHSSVIYTSPQLELNDDKYGQHHHHHTHHLPQVATYSQFQSGQRAPGISSPIGKLNTPTIHNSNNNPLQPHHHQATAHHTNNRHYANNTAKAPTTTTSETLALSTTASTGIAGAGATSSPKPNLNQNILPSPTSGHRVVSLQVCRRQSSSVISTSSAGSNLSDHHSQTESPPGISPQATTNVEQIAGMPDVDRMLTATDGDSLVNKQDGKESQLSQLHQQCAVILDEQQQQHSIAINNQPNNNGTNVSNSSNNTSGTNQNSNTTNNNSTSSNGNNSGRSKRLRTSFKHNQLKEMKRWFSKNQNPDAKDLKTLAQHTGLSKRVLQVWFQNARAKFRRNNAKAANQQLYDADQHTSYMLQFQQHQQQNYHHHHQQHHHHHTTRPLQATVSLATNSHQQQQHQQQQQQQQQLHQHHLPSQDSPTLAMGRSFEPLGGAHQQTEALVTVAAVATVAPIVATANDDQCV